MAAGLVLYARGTTINTMVLAGLVVALGSVVDDAIIDIENIVRRLRENRSPRQPEVGGGRRLRSLPRNPPRHIFRHHGHRRRGGAGLLPRRACPARSSSRSRFSYVLAMLASLIVAMTLTPALALILLQECTVSIVVQPPLGAVAAAPLRDGSCAHSEAPRPTFVAAGCVVVAALAVWPFLGESLLPAFKERDFLMHWLTKPGTSHPEMYRITVQASRELRSIPGVRNFGAHIGRAIAADEVVGIDFTENWVSVDPKADYDKTLRAIQETVEGYPGIYRDVQTYLKERIREVLTGKGESIVVRIYGADLAVLRREAEKVRQALSDVKGLVDLHVDLQAGHS